MIEKYKEQIKGIRSYKTPCDATITQDPPEDAEPFSKEQYAGAVISLMWLSRLTRCDIAFAVNVCSKRCRSRTRWCWQHVLRVLAYLEQTGVYWIVYERVPNPVFKLSCDASHGIYPSGREHQMVVLTWGSGVVAAYSRVIRLITLSSTESEHVAVNDGCTLGIHADHMATEMAMEKLLSTRIILLQYG